MEKGINYYTFAENDYLFLKSNMEEKRVSNAMTSIAQNTCERYLKHLIQLYCIEADWIEQYDMKPGTFDILDVDHELVNEIPRPTQMGKVYMWLILDTLQPAEGYVDGLIRVYKDEIGDMIDNYNCSAYYEPSYVIARAYDDGGF